MMIALRFIFIFSVIIGVSTVSATAQEPESQENTATRLNDKEYSPDYCDFTAIFPEEPYLVNRCEDETKLDTCFDLISYTKVFELSSTIRVEIICNPSTPEMYAEFSPETMENTVRAMTKESVVDVFEISGQNGNGFRQMGLIGKGRKGLDDTIYIAQLWTSENSIMSVEAEMSGQQSDESDKLFASILENIGYKHKTSSDNNVESTPPSSSKAEDETQPVETPKETGVKQSEKTTAPVKEITNAVEPITEDSAPEATTEEDTVTEEEPITEDSAPEATTEEDTVTEEEPITEDSAPEATTEEDTATEVEPVAEDSAPEATTEKDTTTEEVMPEEEAAKEDEKVKVEKEEEPKTSFAPLSP